LLSESIELTIDGGDVLIKHMDFVAEGQESMV
jgi:hypothetical protein